MKLLHFAKLALREQ